MQVQRSSQLYSSKATLATKSCGVLTNSTYESNWLAKGNIRAYAPVVVVLSPICVLRSHKGRGGGFERASSGTGAGGGKSYVMKHARYGQYNSRATRYRRSEECGRGGGTAAVGHTPARQDLDNPRRPATRPELTQPARRVSSYHKIVAQMSF